MRSDLLGQVPSFSTASTLAMSGGCKRAKPAESRPLDGLVGRTMYQTLDSRRGSEHFSASTRPEDSFGHHQHADCLAPRQMRERSPGLHSCAKKPCGRSHRSRSIRRSVGHPFTPLASIRPTLCFTGAKPASAAPPVERPVQALVRRHFRSQTGAGATTGMPECNDDKLSVQNLVVDVIPNSGQIQAAQLGVAHRTRPRTNPRLAREQGNRFLKIDADGVRRRRSVLCPPRCGGGKLYRGPGSYLNGEHVAQAIRRRRSSISSAEMVSARAA